VKAVIEVVVVVIEGKNYLRWNEEMGEKERERKETI
jgi:hypothetical protein